MVKGSPIVAEDTARDRKIPFQFTVRAIRPCPARFEGGAYTEPFENGELLIFVRVDIPSDIDVDDWAEANDMTLMRTLWDGMVQGRT
jgi:hypothetical protein